MKLRFTKMQGAGNDFVMLDATRATLELSTEQYRALADRHFGIGADQVLVVEPPRTPGVDFGYRIFNASGDEVEHCGNGARCFVRFVRERGLTDKRRIRVETVNRVIELQLRDDGRVTVDMGAPEFAHERIPFLRGDLTPRREGDFELWPLELSNEQYRALADRHFGIGADQILVVEPPRSPGVDFGYRIFNASGDEVEHCGNGARCFVRFVRDRGLTDKQRIKVETVNRVIELQLRDDGRVTVDMGAPDFVHEHIPFLPEGMVPRREGDFELWPLELIDGSVEVAVLSMGNPHAVQRVDDLAGADVASIGPEIEVLDCFPQKVNAGFMQVISRSHIALRVFERGAGETLACGTGACAAVVAGIRLGWLDPQVEVDTRGGRLSIEWAGLGRPVLMTGPATTVFEGEIEL